MKLPYKWLREFIETDKSAEEIADKLTMGGLEVEEVIGLVSFSNVIVGEVLEVEKHPNADKLRVAKVNIGKDPLLQIVCGAPNLEKGQKVPVAVIGAKLDGFEIKKASLRGVDSEGMICSEKELGLGEDHGGIMVLSSELNPGTNLDECIGTDKIIDVNIPANRPDCMGVLGLSREAAVFLNTKLNEELPIFDETGQQVTDLANISVEDFNLCPRYVSRIVKNVAVGESPDWLKERLSACGIRPINNLIDISNYVMIALGQPLHFFDIDKLSSNNSRAEIIVRLAKKGEKITTIDGEERILDEGILVISDDEKPVAIAGVMGGNNSEIDGNTKNILIEAAVFNKASIRRTGRYLGLRTEAVARFEKGIPFKLPEVAVDHAAHLLVELANGKVCVGKLDIYESEKELKSIEINIDKVNKFLGLEITEDVIGNILVSLGFVLEKNNQIMLVTPPWWREDILTKSDIYEEIARVYGYDKIPSTLPSTGDTVPKKNVIHNFVQETRSLLCSIGMTEIMTYSFLGEKELKNIGEDITKAPKIANPLVTTQEFMRTSLLPGMLSALRDNQFNKETLEFFEIGNIFVNNGDRNLPIEKKMLSGGVMGGKSWPINYVEGNDFYVIKGIIKRLLSENNYFSRKIELRPSSEITYNQGRSLDIVIDDVIVGSFGEIKKQVLETFNIKREVTVFMVDMNLLFSVGGGVSTFKQFSKFPKVIRDISFIVKEEEQAQKFINRIIDSNELIIKAEVIDIYKGKPFDKDKKSITIRMYLQSDEKTLNENEIDEVFNKVISLVRESGGEVRSGSGS